MVANPVSHILQTQSGEAFILQYHYMWRDYAKAEA